MFRVATLWRVVAIALLVFSLVASAASDAYDPENEGLLDRVLRTFQKRVMSRTDEEITGARLQIAATLNPVFNSRVTSIVGKYDGSSINTEMLHMPPPPEAGIDDSIPWKSFAAPGSRAGGSKVWVILVSAPSGDAASRHFNQVFNNTLNLVEPPEGETVESIIAQANMGPFANVAEEEEIKSEEALELEKKRRERLEMRRQKVRDWHFGVVDFENEPDLMWAWWIWKVPVMVFITPSTSPDRLYDMRFWKVAFISGLTPEYILSYVASGAWKTELKVWKSHLAPGGKRSGLPARLAKPSNWLYDKTAALPSWALGILSTALGGSLISLMHSFGGKKDEKKEEGQRATGGRAVEAGGSPTSLQSQSKKKQ